MAGVIEGFSTFVGVATFPLLICLPAVGIHLTRKLRCLQMTHLCRAFKLAFCGGQHTETDAGLSQGEVSHFEALMTSLATTVGTGNIAGVAVAIARGGPGALLWMWVTGVLGMATKFTEAFLAVEYRSLDANGNYTGGPMRYLAQVVPKPAGHRVARFYAFAVLIATLPMVQTSSISDALCTSLHFPHWLTALILTLLTAAVISGGIQWIRRAASILVPFMILAYMLCALTVVALYWQRVPAVLWAIVSQAFTGGAAKGAFEGSTVLLTMRMGVARGLFSNEAGAGTAAIAAAAARTTQPARQALISMTQTFIDTLIVCSVTGFAILATESHTLLDNDEKQLTGAPLTMHSFDTGLPFSGGKYIVSVCLTLFAYTTVLGWYYCGERCIAFLYGARAAKPYKLLYLAATFVGAWIMGEQKVDAFNLVWDFSELMYAAMTLPNLVGLILMIPTIASETREYLSPSTGAHIQLEHASDFEAYRAF